MMQSVQSNLSLTPAEYRVLEKLLDGMTNREIAADLGRSESTIKKHVEKILIKTGSKNRLQACRAGLLAQVRMEDVETDEGATRMIRAELP